MDIIFTSFGASHLAREHAGERDLFYRMPPASLSSSGQEFLPDYAILLLADRIIIDEKTFELLASGRHRPYEHVATIIKALHDEKFVRLENFDSVISANQNLLETMLERDLSELNSWVKPLKSSLAVWQQNVERFDSSLMLAIYNRMGHVPMNPELRNTFDHLALSFHMRDSTARSRYTRRGPSVPRSQKALRRMLTDYLAYVNANLLLANAFDAAFHDWNDLQPFYNDKFLRVGRANRPGEREIESITTLFSVSFPEFTFWNPKSIIRALTDSRIVELRKLVGAAVDGRVVFDREFAVRTLAEVLNIEQSIGTLRTFVSYATTPLDLIPVVGTPAQKAVEEAIVHTVANRRKKGHRWFYFISELAKHAKELDK